MYNDVDFNEYKTDINILLKSYSTKQFLLNYVSGIVGINITESHIHYLLDEWTIYLYDITSNKPNERLYAVCDDVVRETLKDVSRS